MHPSFPTNDGPIEEGTWAQHSPSPAASNVPAWNASRPATQAAPAPGGAPVGGVSVPMGDMNSLMGAAGPMLGPMGERLGKEIFKNQIQGWWSFFAAFFNMQGFKYYFAVNNSYVLKKLRLVLLPFTHKNFTREPLDVGSLAIEQGAVQAFPGIPYKPPSQDVNAPDLYIPAMAFITFVLLCGYTEGAAGRFTPEVLGATAFSTLTALCLEVLLIRGVFWMAGPAESPAWLDLAAFASYKYVSLILEVLIGLLLGRAMFYLAIAILGCCAAVFLMRTLKPALSPPGEVGVSATVRGKRRTFLLAVGVLQLFACWLLVRNTLPAAVLTPRLPVGSPVHDTD